MQLQCEIGIRSAPDQERCHANANNAIDSSSTATPIALHMLAHRNLPTLQQPPCRRYAHHTHPILVSADGVCGSPPRSNLGDGLGLGRGFVAVANGRRDSSPAFDTLRPGCSVVRSTGALFSQLSTISWRAMGQILTDDDVPIDHFSSPPDHPPSPSSSPRVPP